MPPLSRFACCVLAFFIPAAIAQAADLPYDLQVPEGFTVELAAGSDLVQHPTMAGFDDRGRLFVADNQGENMPAKELLEKLPNAIRCLEDTNGDGKFDKSTIFADKLTFPMGALWHDGWLYVASPPHIWRFRDTNDDGVADQREILVSEFGFTGNAADIHGCFLGPDGRIYWCDGRHGHNFTDKQGNSISKGLAARVFSCRADGSDVEAYAGGGMDNPVEVTFTSEGEILGTVAIFERAAGRVDALIHWVYGGVYPHHHCVSEFKRTGDLLPAVSRFGQVAPSGVMRYRGSQFGDTYRDNIFHAQFNTHSVVRTELVRSGASFQSVDEPFLTCEHPDFHPTDVLEDADGSLLVVDTGGWFRIGCPLSQIAKPEIKGGIYRVRRSDGAAPPDPRGLKLAWDEAPADELAARLNDPRPAVRDRAIATLARRGPASVEVLSHLLSQAGDVATRRNAVWTACRIDDPRARQLLVAALDDDSASVRISAARAVASVREASAFEPLLQRVRSDEPAVRREAATALGRLHRIEAVPVLLDALADGNDRILEHALIFALIEINDRATTLAGLSAASPNTRRGALIALDQMDSGDLQRAEVAPLLNTTDAALQKTVLEVIAGREGWAADAAQLVADWLADPQPTAERLAMTTSILTAFSHDAAMQSLVAETLAADATPVATRLALLDVVGRSDFSEEKLPAAWRTELARHLGGDDERVVRHSVAAVSALDARGFDKVLLDLADHPARAAELRVAALAIAARHGQPLSHQAFQFLLSRLDEQLPPVDRLAAADTLAAARLSGEQLDALLRQIHNAGPLELPSLVAAFDPGEDRQGSAERGVALVLALQSAPGVDNLPPAALDSLLKRYPDEVKAASKALFKRLNVDLEAQQARLDELMPLLEGGDKIRGRAVFNGTKTACNACHRVSAEGPNIGPDLSKIGQIRTPVSLLESVVFPSASLARGFESYTVMTHSGRVVTGVLSRETADSVYLQTAQREEVRIARSEVEDLQPSAVSIMPQGIERLMTEVELRDLLAYLQSLK